MSGEFDGMTTKQLAVVLRNFDGIANATRMTQEKLRLAGVDEGVVRGLGIPTSSYERADRMEEELKRRMELERA